MKYLESFIANPYNEDAIVNLASEYQSLGQTSAAFGLYLRAAEITESIPLQYECLIQCAQCLEQQQRRPLSTRDLYMHAISVMPTRPEAYYFLSRLYERGIEGNKDQRWHSSYMLACIGLSMSGEHPPFRTNVQYPGTYALLFQKGVAAYWIERIEESREIMYDLITHYELDNSHLQAVKFNIQNIGHSAPHTKFSPEKAARLRYKFTGYDKIQKNYAQSYQDLFVLSMLNGKTQGTYLEVGSGYPFYNNNTALLEQLGWKGISIEYDKDLARKFFNERKNTILCEDATTVDYEKVLSQLFSNTIDYLQLDTDPPEVTYSILTKIPFDKYKFAVITFEHDAYTGSNVKNKSREFLSSKGYKLIVSDVAFNPEGYSFEDWWVHPDLVTQEIITQMSDISPTPKYVESYLFPMIDRYPLR